MDCLVCSSPINEKLCWNTFLIPAQQTQLCPTCTEELQPLQGKRCSICSLPTICDICADCLEWKESRPSLDTLDSNFALFPYTSMIQTILAQWKYRGDYELGSIFKPMVQSIFKRRIKISDSTLILPIPLSKERLHERAFNQATMIATWIGPPTESVLEREHHEKQAKKSRHDRISSINPFILTKAINKPVLLVDDIYTTGTTLRHVSTLLKQNGCPRVDAFTLIR